ncbi:MAG: hypothetical protein M1838_003600 [Thelocarpon superellum]|nr:MAG: hypothetical protein M1838_003600 [Thelocarpon superellum]
MLSNPNSSLYQRQRQHRRQNSTPNAFQAPKVPLLPATAVTRHGMHRRGQSLDQRTPSRRQSLQEGLTVSTTPGLQPNQQHILREAQQQRLARPGQPPNHAFLTAHLEEPPAGCFDACFSSTGGLDNHSHSHSQPQGHGHHPATDLHQLAGGPSGGEPYHLNVPPGGKSGPPAGYLDGFGSGLDENHMASNYGRMKHPHDRNACVTLDENGIARRWSQQMEPGSQLQRPNTPPNASNAGRWPLTPDATPHRGQTQNDGVRHVQANGAEFFRDGAGHERRPSALLRSGSCADIFTDGSHSVPRNALPSPPNTGPLTFPTSYELVPMPNANFMSMSSLNMNLSESDNGYDSSYYSPLSAALSPSQSSFLSSPEMEQLQLFGNPLETAPNLAKPVGVSILPSSQSSVDLSDSGSPMKGMPSRSMSVADLNLDASIKDTGITLDDISTFIEGPDPADGKWVCLYPDCNKKFGRKENIKSHVQTHLGDRQYRCNHCKKCFVRQHDLKRHAKIHSGVKPYPCLCGNSFARHDALTRHRQRGMCIGAFEGVVKKVAKRGRPRKHRPEADERHDKATRTRQKAVAMSQSSSASGASVHSYDQGSPAGDDGEGSLSSRSMSPLELLTQGFQPDEAGPSSGGPRYTPPTSPHTVSKACVEPLALHHSPSSDHSPVASSSAVPDQEMMESLPAGSTHASPGKSSSSQYNTPPDLCLSSSSPPSSRLFGLEAAVADAGPEQQSIEHMFDDNANFSDFGLTSASQQANDMFLDFSRADEEMTTLEKDPNMLLFDRLDEAFTDGSFGQGSGSDMFF